MDVFDGHGTQLGFVRQVTLIGVFVKPRHIEPTSDQKCSDGLYCLSLRPTENSGEMTAQFEILARKQMCEKVSWYLVFLIFLQKNSKTILSSVAESNNLLLHGKLK